MDEFSLIARYFRPLAMHKAARGLRDDAAVFAPPVGQELVVTKDILHAGVHFFADDPPRAVAQKALRVSLSDLAAMGAAPFLYFLGLGLPEQTDETWVAAFADGLAADQAEYGISLGGGDTTRSGGVLSISITALGLVNAGQALSRSGAQAGDTLYLTGTAGDAALGLMLRRGEITAMPPPLREAAAERYLLPAPRLKAGVGLYGLATAVMDVSDGLVQDAGHLCAASGVGAVIAMDKVPLSAAMAWVRDHAPDDFLAALCGGDDYELLFTAPPSAATALAALAERTATPITAIGRISAGQEAQLLGSEGIEIAPPSGYRHRW